MFTLGRTVDIHYSTNRWILILTVITAIIGFFTSGEPMTGLKIGATIFLTWALSRELDPKREYGAFVSVAFVLYIFFVPFNVALMEVAFFLLALRLISTTCGKKPTWFDALTVVGIAGYLSYTSDNPIFILLAVIGVFLSGALSEIMILHRILSLLTGGALGYILSMFFVDATMDTPIFSFPLLLTITILYSLSAYFDLNSKKKILDDQNNEISPFKIFKSQLFFAGSFILIILFSNIAIGNVILYLASMFGLTLYDLISRVIKIED